MTDKKQEPVEDLSLPPETVEHMDDGPVPDLADAAAIVETGDVPDAPKSVLSAKEEEAVRRQAEREIENERKIQARADLLKKEKAKLRERHSINDNSALSGRASDMVMITINIPEFSNCPWIQVNLPNGPKYYHGQTYTVPRHIANSLRESMQWMRRHQNELDGKKRNRQLPDGRFIDAVTGGTPTTSQTGIVRA